MFLFLSAMMRVLILEYTRHVVSGIFMCRVFIYSWHLDSYQTPETNAVHDIGCCHGINSTAAIWKSSTPRGGLT